MKQYNCGYAYDDNIHITSHIYYVNDVESIRVRGGNFGILVLNLS